MVLIHLLSDWSGFYSLSFVSLDRWYSESARWLVLNRRSEDALKSLHRVARINGKPEMVDRLTMEVNGLSAYSLPVCLPVHLSVCLSTCRY